MENGHVIGYDSPINFLNKKDSNKYYFYVLRFTL